MGERGSRCGATDLGGRAGQGRAGPRPRGPCAASRSTRAGSSRGWSRATPGTWVYAVDGLVGATPELLCRLERGLVTSRVLAGTIRRTGDDAHDLALAGSLARSSKDLEEHEYAAASVAESLAPHCSSLNLPESPFVLHLPNVMHLATDIAGVVADGSSSLELAAALHPVGRGLRHARPPWPAN